jgi:hypothetical protein
VLCLPAGCWNRFFSFFFVAPSSSLAGLAAAYFLSFFLLTLSPYLYFLSMPSSRGCRDREKPSLPTYLFLLLFKSRVKKGEKQADKAAVPIDLCFLCLLIDQKLFSPLQGRKMETFCRAESYNFLPFF